METRTVHLIVLILIIDACVIGGLTFGAISLNPNGSPSETLAVKVNQKMSSSGTIMTTSNIGVYCDSRCTTNMTSISWGSLTPGDSVNQTVYVKDTGASVITLSLATSNWSPKGANTYITISWNQQGTQLSPGQLIPAILTLTVSSNIAGITSFSNSISMSGTG
ncbi:MAG: hypothetical protein ABSF44_11410 [Candidatus Bathyarchaeia archaeon]|jgi:hypothetical protein